MNKSIKKLGAVICSLAICTVAFFGAFSTTAKAATQSSSSMSLVDGTPSTQIISGGSVGIFPINESDAGLKNIMISSNVPVRSLIVPDNSALSSFIGFSSGDSRMFNSISWHFIPGIQYNLLVIPDSTASVTVNMSAGSPGLTWLNIGSQAGIGYTLTEKNELFGGQTEQYGIAIQSPGTYRINVQSASNSCSATIVNALNQSQSVVKTIGNNGSAYATFTVPTATGQAENDYAVILTSNDSPNSGAPYTITITKVSN